MITLTQVDGTRLYQVERSTEPGFLTYYVSDEQVPTPELPPSLTVHAAWTREDLCGYFLILPAEPADIAVFAEVAKGLGFAVPTHASFAWVQYQQSPPKVTTTYQLALEPGADRETALIATGTTFRFGTYGLPFMPQGVVRAFNAGVEDITKFSFEYPLAYPADRPPDLPPELPPTEGTGVNVPLTGSQRYVLQSLGLIGDFANDSGQGWDVGVRYFYDQGGKTLSQFYPIFALPGSGYQVEFMINWDPLAPLDSKRSWMKFTGNAYQITVTGEGEGRIEVAANGNVIPSWLRTIYGDPLWLRPVLTGDHAAKLVMQPRPGAHSGETAYYLVPDGDYEVLTAVESTAESTPGQLNLLCGLAGTESIGFYPGTPQVPLTVVRFHPWMPAYAPVFPLADAASGLEASGAFRPQATAQRALLDDTWPTAWLSVGPVAGAENSDTTYFAQPEQASLYDQPKSAPATNILKLYQAPVAVFRNADLNRSFPLAMYAGLATGEIANGFPAENVRRFETQILNQVRKESISATTAAQRELAQAKAKARRAKAEPPPPPEVTTTTPQGLLAKVQGLKWNSVLLARNNEDGSKLEFTDLQPELREALQSNQLFLVASLAEPLGSFAHDITIAEWPFKINVGENGEGGDYRNVLVFKFGQGTIKDLAADPKSWTQANVFNEDPALMSLFLQNYIANAATSAEENYRFKKFVDIVSNPAWEGILALKVTVGLSDFPDDLKGLLAGMDLTRFGAHHFGIESSFIKTEGGLNQAKSSLFGLISYVDRDYQTRQNTQAFYQSDRMLVHVPQVVQAVDPQDELYDFKVLQMEVVFENSDLLDFTSRIQVTTTRWFGEPATLQSGYPPDPIDVQSIDLNGSYEIHNGERSYSFYTEEAQTYKFLIASHVLNYVQMVKARFETLRSAPQPDGSEDIFTRFSFWGYLNFKEQEGFDLFSFGGQVNPQLSEKEGLYFSNLGISMDFSLLPDETTGERVFAFDAGLASYDISQSQVRVNSLFNRFPMKITSILQSDGRGNPADLGYLSVRTPKAFKALRLSKEWYAINFKLNLGSMGALAEQAGFSAGLILAWSPAETTVRAEVQIKLPGTGGGKKLLSLQGVLKLSIQYFEFTTTKKGSEDLQYQLFFRNSGLSLLGKKLPTAGRIDMVLGGDPDRKLDAGSLAWLAAYYREDKTTPLAVALLEE